MSEPKRLNVADLEQLPDGMGVVLTTLPAGTIVQSFERWPEPGVIYRLETQEPDGTLRHTSIKIMPDGEIVREDVSVGPDCVIEVGFTGDD